jgi:hypothetical protein
MMYSNTEKIETFDGHVQINHYDAEELRHEMEEDRKLIQFIFHGDEVTAEEKNSSSVIRYIHGYISYSKMSFFESEKIVLATI